MRVNRIVTQMTIALYIQCSFNNVLKTKFKRARAQKTGLKSTYLKI